MTPREAEGWARVAATSVCVAVLGEGTRADLQYIAEALTCRYKLGEHHGTLLLARQWLALIKSAFRGPGICDRQTRLLLIFIRRLTRHVDGWTPPRCGRCSDTGVIHVRHERDVWPVACRRCRPEEHGRQLCRRVSAWMSAHGRPSLTQEGENG